MTEPSAYFRLKSNQGYLSGLTIGESDCDFTATDARKAEKFAKAHIDGVLGCRFSTEETGLTPSVVEELAEIIAAALLLKKHHASNGSADGLASVDELEKSYKRTIKDLRGGVVGIQNTDGSWNSNYPGANNREEGKSGGGLIFIG